MCVVYKNKKIIIYCIIIIINVNLLSNDKNENNKKNEKINNIINIKHI